MSIMNNYSTAKDFFISKNIQCVPSYLVTYYNVDTNEDIAEIYGCKNYFVKVWNNEIIEFYISNVQFSDHIFAYVSKDINTDVILDYYDYCNEGVLKLTDNTIVHFSNFDSIPKEYLEERNLSDDFKFKSNVIHWTLKPYGLILEYIDKGKI